MTKSLEALVADMKAAAEKATPGKWVYLPKNTSIEYDVGSYESQGSICYMDSGDFTQRITELNGLHVSAANPENTLKLIVALEQAQQEIKEQSARIEGLEAQRKLAFMACNRWRDKCVDAEKRISKIEKYSKTTIEFREAARKENVGLKSDLATAEKRIAELEALCVKSTDAMREVAPLCVKLPESFYPDGDIECPKVVNVYQVIEAIRAAGGTVEGSD